MAGSLKRLEWVYQFLVSKKLTIIIFLVLGVIFIPRTFSEETDIQVGYLGNIFFGLLSLNMILCTVQRIKTLANSVLFIQIGILVTFAGVVISSFGYIATVNIYEGTSVDTVYRWDKEKDMSLGADLRVEKIHVKYYPFPVKIGVLRGDEKVGLFELKTGESFQLEGYTVKAETVEFPSKNLNVSIFNGDHFIGTANTAGPNDLPADFPYDFRLVAFKTPNLDRLWLDLTISKDSEVVAKGTSEVNGPLTWEKISFHNTAVDVDEYGNPYAGIQITYDPGITYVFTGFIILSLGCVMYAMRRFYAYRF